MVNMKRVVGVLCLVILLGLMLTYCEGRKHFKEGGHWRGGDHGKGGEHGEGREHWKGGDHGKDGGNEHHGNNNNNEHGGEHGEGREHGWGGHGKDGWRHGHGWRHHRGHFRQVFANLSLHFVEDNLPPNVYVVLSDKGLELKAAYERMGNSTALTKVGLRVADKHVVVKINGNMAIDGIESEIAKFDSLQFENGEMKKMHGAMLVRFGPYRIFMRVNLPSEDSDSDSDEERGHRGHYQMDKDMVPHIGLHIAVEKTAKVTPGGFIGARMAVDPTQYTSPEAI